MPPKTRKAIKARTKESDIKNIELPRDKSATEIMKTIGARANYFLPEDKWEKVGSGSEIIQVDMDKPLFYADERGKDIPQQTYLLAVEILNGNTIVDSFARIGKVYKNTISAQQTFMRLKKKSTFQRALLLASKHIQVKLERREMLEGFDFSKMDSDDFLKQLGYYSSLLKQGTLDDKQAAVLLKLLDTAAEIKGLKNGKKSGGGTSNNLTINYNSKTDAEINAELKKMQEQLLKRVDAKSLGFEWKDGTGEKFAECVE